MPTRRKRGAQVIRAKAEQIQPPPAVNQVEQRVAEESLHHPRQKTTPECNPAPGPQGITKQEVVPEGPLEAPQEVGNLQMMVPTDEGDEGLALAPRNRRRRVSVPAWECHQEETHHHRTPPMTPASVAVKPQTRPMPTKSRG